MERDSLGHEALDIGHLFRLNGDVRSLALNATKRLMHHDAGVRKRVALASGSGAQQELTHRCSESHANGSDIGGNELHRVVDGHTGGD